MGLIVRINQEDPRHLTLLWDGEPWRVVCKFLFLKELNTFSSEPHFETFMEKFALLERKVAKRYVLALLSKKGFLSGALGKKLEEKGFSSPVIKETLAYCQERGMLNDSEELSRLISKERKKGKSVRATYFKLRQKKGVDASMLHSLIKEDPHSEEEALEKVLLKYSNKMTTKEEVRKVAQKLCQKGFSPELVFKRLYHSSLKILK